MDVKPSLARLARQMHLESFFGPSRPNSNPYFPRLAARAKSSWNPPEDEHVQQRHRCAADVFDRECTPKPIKSKATYFDRRAIRWLRTNADNVAALDTNKTLGDRLFLTSWIKRECRTQLTKIAVRISENEFYEKTNTAKATLRRLLGQARK